MKATDMLNKVKELVGVEASEEVKLAQATLENGAVIESEDFAAGSEVFIVTDDESSKVALPVGEYTLEDGETLVVEEEGIIASIGKQEEAPAEEEASKEENLEEEEMAYATKEELAEVKTMIEEIKAMIEKKEDMSEELEEVKEDVKEELSKVEEKVELEKVTHNPEAEPKKEMKLYGQKRPETTMDRVFSKIANIKK